VDEDDGGGTVRNSLFEYLPRVHYAAVKAADRDLINVYQMNDF